MPSYQPFPITEFKTGLYNYLQPWIRPIEAFEPLQDAYIYRGTLNKRMGYVLFGVPHYRNNQIIATGNGGATYSGTLSDFPVLAGTTFNVTVLTSGGVETFSQTVITGASTITGSLGDTFNINYTTGVWSITLIGGRTVAANRPFVAGYTFIPTAETTPVTNVIMGLKVWSNQSGTSSKLLALDTRRASVYNNSTRVFDPISTVSQVLWVGDNSTTTITFATGWTNIAPYSVSITDGTTTITDNGVTPTGTFTSGGNFAAGSTITYASGSVTINLVAASTATFTIAFSLQGDYFTGTTANFFNATNWLSPSQYTTDGSLYMTNNVDRITLFDGTNLSRPPFPITSANNITFTNDISFCLDIDVYKNRLIIQRPSLVGSSTVAGQSFRWSAVNSPTNLVADVTGNGGEASAPTNDVIQSSEFLRDVIVVPFKASTWVFRYTNNYFDPFRWDKANSTKACNAPYGTIPYDQRVTFMGAKGLVACDGVNVQRYDLSVIDEFLDINQNHFQQCYGFRFDPTNQSFMTFPSASTTSTTSNRILVYNFLENTWAVYNLPMSCFGEYQLQTDVSWSSFAVGQPLAATWEQADFPWNYYLNQTLAPVLLGGDFDGKVYQMNTSNQDSGSTITCDILSTRWNPFIQLGQKVQFGYIDFYYATNADCTLTINFYLDNSEDLATSSSVSLDANGDDSSAGSPFAMKRVYINGMGEFLQMEIISSSNATFQINGFILWCRPAGRLTP